MNWLDIVMAILLVSSMASAFSKGFVRESIGLAAAFIGLLCGAWFYRMAADPVRPYVGSQQAANLCGFLLIFLGALVLGWLVSKVVSMLVKAVGMSWLDRLLGAAFGTARGILVCVAVITAIVAFAPGTDAKTPPRSVVDSKMAPYMIDAANVLTIAAPRELRDEFERRYDEVKRIWQNAVKYPKRSPETEI